MHEEREGAPWYAKMLFVVDRFIGNANVMRTVVRLSGLAPAISVKLKYAPGNLMRPFVKLTVALDMFVGGFAATAMRTGSVYTEIVAFTGSVELDGMNARECGTAAADAPRAPMTSGRAVENMIMS
jgi:hypothetical protein